MKQEKQEKQDKMRKEVWESVNSKLPHSLWKNLDKIKPKKEQLHYSKKTTRRKDADPSMMVQAYYAFKSGLGHAEGLREGAKQLGWEDGKPRPKRKNDR